MRNGMGMTARCVCAAVLAASVVAMAGCGPTAYKITPIASDAELDETILRRGEGLLPPKVAIIDVSGMLVNMRQSELFTSGENPTALIVEKLRTAREDDRVKAVVLRINSPGGTVTASDIIHHHVRKLAECKPVVAYIMDVGASGGYYVACGAGEIMAEPTGVTGSIGVIMLTFDLSGLMDLVGVSTEAIKSGPRKDAGSPFRGMSDAERAMFQSIIDEFHGNFVDVVIAARSKVAPDRIRALADGRVMTGRQAMEAGLIDRVGTIDDAIDRSCELAEIGKPHVVIYHRPAGYRGTVYSAHGRDVIENNDRPITLINVETPETMGAQQRFMYLWRP